MDWTPCSDDELAILIADAVKVMKPPIDRLWNLIRIPTTKWALHPWGDLGGGFWVVGVIGRQVVWYNDIEEGFNISRYTTPGVIDEYWCNQDELQDTLSMLLWQIETGKLPAVFGPPEPLT